MDRILRQFSVVATCKNVSHAALRLCISQPTLSHNMKKLESELGVTLFTRSSNGIELTESGEVLLEQVRIMQRLYDNTLIKLEHINRHHERELKIGTGHAWWHLFLRNLVKSYRQLHPAANLNVDIGNHLRQMDLLMSGDIDLFIGHEIVGLHRKAEVKFIPLFTSIDAIYVRKDHPLTLKESCTLADLIDYPTMEATPNENSYSHLIEDTQQLRLHRNRHHLPEKILYASNSLTTAIDITNDSNALLPFPESMENYFRQMGLVRIPINEHYSDATIGIYLLREMADDVYIGELLQLIKKEVTKAK